MGGSPTQTTQQQSQSSPWAPAVPALTGLLAQIGAQGTGLTGGQQNALQGLQTAAGGLPNFNPQLTGTANSLFSGGPNFGGTLSGAYGNLQNSLSPLTNPNNLNPMNTPGFSDAMNTMGSDITNRINSQFAAAGRDLSPANSTALARGLSQGEGQLIANQYNQNAGNLMGASNAQFGAGAQTAGGMQNFGQQNLQNQLAGSSLVGSLPGLMLGNQNAQLQAANTGFTTPFANMGTAENLMVPIAGLGGQSSGTATQQTQVPMWQQILGGGMGAAGMFGSLFGAPAGGTSAVSGFKSLFS